MTSPMSHPNLCCVCLAPILAGGNAQDSDGDLWDAHAGECAAKAGIGGDQP